jgi:hypothetical protein
MQLDAAAKRSFAERFDAIRRLSPDSLIPDEERWKASIKDFGLWDFLVFDDKTWVIRQIGKYYEFSDDFKKKKKYHWTELRMFAIETGEVKHIEWEIDDELEIVITAEKLDFSQLKDDEGEAIDEDDLDEIAENKWSILYNGTEYAYSDDYGAKYYPDCKSKAGDKLYLYDFLSRDKQMITIEEWDSGSGDETYEIYTSRIASESEFEILTSGGNTGNE